jgi:uncharacterized Tic20 family protein
MTGAPTPSAAPAWQGRAPGRVPASDLAHLRVSDNDRDQVVEHVKAAYTAGRLDKLEFDERLERAMTARTHADLMPIMRDLYGSRPAHPTSAGWDQSGRGQAGWNPQGSGVMTSGDRVGAGAAHLLPLLGISIVGPLIMMLVAGKTSPHVRRHAVEALNFQLTVLGGSLLLMITVVGVLLLPVLWVAAFVLSVIAGVSALAGGEYRYPLTVRLVK